KIERPAPGQPCGPWLKKLKRQSSAALPVTHSSGANRSAKGTRSRLRWLKRLWIRTWVPAGVCCPLTQRWSSACTRPKRVVVGRRGAEHDDPGEPLEGEVDVLEPQRPAEREQPVRLGDRGCGEAQRVPVGRPARVEHRLGEGTAVGPEVAPRDGERMGLERAHP